MNSILLIDDDKDYTFLMSCFFRKFSLIDNYKIENDVPSALDYLGNCGEDEFPKVIFVDINMPVDDGFGFLNAYQKNFSNVNPDTEIYMLTSSVRSSDHEKALRYPSVKDILVKPVSKEKLHDIFNLPVE